MEEHFLHKMEKILCDQYSCKFNSQIETTHYNHGIAYVPIKEIGMYKGECSKSEIVLSFRDEEIQGEYLIKHKIVECKSFEKI